jgi:cytidine deaminase
MPIMAPSVVSQRSTLSAQVGLAVGLGAVGLAASYLHQRRAQRPNDEAHWLQLALQIKARTSAPRQSHFRVIAVVVFRTVAEGTGALGPVRHVVGCNDENNCLGGAICAERAAFVQFRNIEEPVRVLGVYITTDSPVPITPGMLCREFMLAHPACEPDTKVAACGADGSTIYRTTLGELLPHASPYTRLNRGEQVAFGEAATAALERPPPDTPQGKAYHAASAACAGDARDELHPVRYGAAIVFSDGSTHSVSQLKALEYGCTLDPVGLLAPGIQAKVKAGVRPTVVALVDQWGVAHAPFAPGRAYLSEYGCGDVQVVVHDFAGPGGGTLSTPLAATLAPSPPAFDTFGGGQ